MSPLPARRLAAVALIATLMIGGAGRALAAPPRVLSLGQCSDQFVLALAPRSSIVGLSPRVGDRDSYLRAQSIGLPRRRASVEAILAARPDVVVYWWLGDARLAQQMSSRLLEQGVYVIGFSFPVVPRGQARIRTQMSAAHEPAHVDRAVEAFSKVGRELGVI